MSWDEWFKRIRKRYPFFDIDRDLFSSPFSSFAREFDEFMGDWERMVEKFFKEFTEKMPQRMTRERKLPDGRIVRELGPIVYGFSVKIGPDGKPEIKTFGDLKPTIPTRPWRPPIDFSEEREPLVDVIDGDREVKVVVELPGVEKENIKLNATETRLTVGVSDRKYKYHKEVELPTEVDPKKAKSTYRNGILEVTLVKKRVERKPEGESIKID